VEFLLGSCVKIASSLVLLKYLYLPTGLFIITIYVSMKHQDIIALEFGKRSKKPCVRRMQITVYDVFSYLASGMTQDEIPQDFPALTITDIIACLSYAADREQITLTIAA
jgi:uncharacterized protein (DUF433 family)